MSGSGPGEKPEEASGVAQGNERAVEPGLDALSELSRPAVPFSANTRDVATEQVVSFVVGQDPLDAQKFSVDPSEQEAWRALSFEVIAEQAGTYIRERRDDAIYERHAGNPDAEADRPFEDYYHSLGERDRIARELGRTDVVDPVIGTQLAEIRSIASTQIVHNLTRAGGVPEVQTPADVLKFPRLAYTAEVMGLPEETAAVANGDVVAPRGPGLRLVPGAKGGKAA